MSSEDVNKIKVEKVYDEYIKMDVYKLPLLQATYCPKMNDLRRLCHCVGCEHKLGYVESHRETYCIYPNIKRRRPRSHEDTKFVLKNMSKRLKAPFYCLDFGTYVRWREYELNKRR